VLGKEAKKGEILVRKKEGRKGKKGSTGLHERKGWVSGRKVPSKRGKEIGAFCHGVKGKRRESSSAKKERKRDKRLYKTHQREERRRIRSERKKRFARRW